MLKNLYDYAVLHALALPPGFVNKPVKAYVALSREGAFLDIELTARDNELTPCPDIGSLANGTKKSNVLAEKCSLVLSSGADAKAAFFRETLADCAKAVPLFAACVHALSDEPTREAILCQMDKYKVKPMDRISFQVDGQSILESAAVKEWWTQYRKQFIATDGGEQALCLITGQKTVPIDTVPTIRGLSIVGGHAKGDALICFDKPAFCSYGLKQGANAPVSAEAFAAVKAALDELIAQAPVLAGMKFVHWYDRPIPKEKDILFGTFAGMGPEDEPEEDDPPPEEDTATAATAKRAADALIESVDSGDETLPLASVYYILLLSGVGGRVMIRRYEQGSYEQLQNNLNLWRKDISLLNRTGTKCVDSRKLAAMLIRLLARQKSQKDVFARLAKELPGITPTILTSILTGAPLPDTVAARELAYIRSQMLDTDEDAGPPVPDEIACQWLKAWLLRRERAKGQEETLMMEFNPNHPSPAYHCGAIMATYAAIQKRAMPDVNAGILQRYYAAAMRTPALVLSQLERLSTFHLDKIEYKKKAREFETRLNELYTAIGDTIPVTLTLAEQSYFVLGYRQYNTKLAVDERNEKLEKVEKERAAAQKEKCEEEFTNGN